jgi:putative ABC transport system permease protein
LSGPLKLAWKYIVYHKFKSLVLVACIFLTAFLPIAIKLLLWQFNQKIVSRADQTPAVVGARGSSLDLTLSSLYFKNDTAETIPFSNLESIRDAGLAQAIPIHALYTARNHPVVGTTIDYFDFRGLQLETGTSFTILGDCVLGAKVAESVGLGVGDQILSDRENVLNLAGQTPLNLNIAGVLTENRTPDDWAVFVDLKTAWVIQGLGHGHQDLNEEADDSEILLSKSDDKIVASAGVASYIEITPGNLDSFHFHGNMSDFPITSIIVVADSIKNETILQGRYDAEDAALQFVKPGDEVRNLMDLVFQIKRFFDANAVLIAISTLLLLLLVVILSMQLREREMETMFKLGSSKKTIGLLQFWELGIIFSIAMILLAAAVFGLWTVSGDWVESLLLNSS